MITFGIDSISLGKSQDSHPKAKPGWSGFVDDLRVSKEFKSEQI